MTGHLRIARGLDLDPDVAGGWTFGVLAKKGAGKTYTGRVMAEEMLGAGIPIVALDPTGAWWGLRAGADGKADGGLQVVIFGGEHGDVPLEPTAGIVMADLVVDERVSMVLDVSGFGTRTAERRFAKDFLDRLYRRNRDLVHLFVDEADLFAPQKPQAGDQPLLGVMENLVRRGRIKGIGCTLITQRPAVLNKDVLTQVDVLALLRIVGPQDRLAVQKWVEGKGTAEQLREVFDSLASLQNGESWWWSPEIDLFCRTQVRKARTFDSSPTPRRGGAVEPPKQLADVDLDAVRAKVAATIERAAADDPKALRARIRELELQAATIAPAPEPERVEVEVVVERVPDFVIQKLERAGNRAQTLTDEIAELRAAIDRLEVHRLKAKPRAPLPVSAPRAREQNRTREPERMREQTSNGDGPPVKAGARRMLEAVASLHPMPLTRAQVGTLAKVKKTGGTYSTYLGVLKQRGYLVEENDRLTITPAGFDAIGGQAAAPATADELRALWRDRLKAGARRMLDELLARHPDGLTRAELAAAAEVAVTGGTFSTYLGMLRTAGLIEETGGEIRAGEVLFLGASA